jgi:hypothetical protein
LEVRFPLYQPHPVLKGVVRGRRMGWGGGRR